MLQQAYKGIPGLAKFWTPDNLQNRFLLEAKRLWELDLGISRLTFIHAAQVLHGVLNGNGLGTVGDFYTSEAITMAHNLRIFESAPVQMNPRLRRGREFTAWAIWLWQVGVVDSCPVNGLLPQDLLSCSPSRLLRCADSYTELLLSTRTLR